MRRLLLALIALCAAAPAFGLGADGYIEQRTTRKPVAIVYFDNNPNSVASDLNFGLGRFITAVKEQGNEVHQYNSEYFRAHTDLWRNMGSKYSVAFCVGARPYFSSDLFFMRRFFHPDSTNVHVIQFGSPIDWTEYQGGGDTTFVGTGCNLGNKTAEFFNSAAGTGDNTGFAFTTPRGDSAFLSAVGVGTAGMTYFTRADRESSTYTGVSISSTNANKAGAFTQAMVGAKVSGVGIPSDAYVRSVYGGAGPYNNLTLYSLSGAAFTDGTISLSVSDPDSTQHDVAKIVQLFKPTSNKQVVVTATATFKVITNTDSLRIQYADSLANYDREILPVAWRVYRQSGKWMDFVAVTDPTLASTVAHVVWGLAARYAQLDPLPVGYEWDDYGTFGYDRPDTTSGTAAKPWVWYWPQPDTLKNWRARMASVYGMKVQETTGPADSLKAKATTTQNGKKYADLADGSWSFVAHVHDSTTAHRLGMVLGRGSHASCYSSCLVNDHRVAFGNDPTLSTADYRQLGIYQRLVAQDSAFVANFGKSSVCPYLSFPTDASAPLGWRRWTYFSTSNVANVPPDSFFLAIAAAGKKYVRATIFNQDPTTDVQTTNLSNPSTTDTTASPVRCFSNADERYTSSASALVSVDSLTAVRYHDFCSGGFKVQNIAAISITASFDTSSVTYLGPARWRFQAQQITAAAMGLVYQRPSPPNADPISGLGKGTGMLTRNSDWGKYRMVYQHPEAAAYNGTASVVNQEAEMSRVQLFDNIKAMEGLAGHTLVKWVRPWEVFQ